MPLASQSSRQGLGHRYLFRRRKGKARWIWVLVLAGVGVGGYFYWKKSGRMVEQAARLDEPVAPDSTDLRFSRDPAASVAEPASVERMFDARRSVTSQAAQGGVSATRSAAAEGPVREVVQPAMVDRLAATTVGPEVSSDREPLGIASMPQTPGRPGDSNGLDGVSISGHEEPLGEGGVAGSNVGDRPVVAASRSQLPMLANVGPVGGGDESVAGRSATGSDSTNSSVPASGSSLEPVQDWRIQAGRTLIDSGRLVEGRVLLSQLLAERGEGLSRSEAEEVREALTRAGQTLVFSPQLVSGDPTAEQYTVQSGDLLSRIAPQYNITYQLLELINRVDARRIRAGQQIKVIRGPFHAVVDKSEFRMDVFLQGPDGTELYVRSFDVGLGESNSTPMGNWVVRRGSKMANPSWTNPRTGAFFAPDDPKNPVGEYWIGLEGAEERTRDLMGYGIHGTIEPESVGRSASMGCVRLRDEDIALVYKLLVEGTSTVTIQP